MGPLDFLVIGIIALIIGAIIFYIVISKKRGVKCIGCPDAASCSSNGGGCQGNCSGCNGGCHRNGTHPDKNNG